MDRSKTFREIRYHEKRDKILQNAAKLFAENGYENVSMAEIAAGLMLNKATLYYYFKSKDEILFLIQMQAIAQANETLIEVLRSEMGPEKKLREAIKSHVRIVTRDYITAIFRHREFVLPRELMIQVIAAKNRFERNFEKIILEGIEQGVFRKENWKLYVLPILGALNAIPAWYSPEGKLSADQIGEAISAFVIKGKPGVGPH